jgi:uncharacterized protein YjiS (DUF1127 family)
MEGSSTIYGRRIQHHAGYALIEVLAGLCAAAWSGLRAGLAAFAESQRQARARRELSNLSDHFLKDIGVDRNQIDGLFR